jgi:hypothetical protein
MFFCCECCVLSGRGLCDKLITRPEESYRLWPVVICDHKTSRARRPWPAIGPQSHANNNNIRLYFYFYNFRQYLRSKLALMNIEVTFCSSVTYFQYF